MVALFSELGLSKPTLKAITELGYEEPTPIQLQTIRLVLEGHDVIAQAQTGTGKTAAFALPIIDLLDPSVRAPQALVLTPTRELAIQVAEAFQSYSKYQRVSILPVYGGQPIERQLRALERGVQVVVGTPGRIIDHLKRRTLKLDHIRTVILDEADEMLNMGFIEDIETILSATPQERQTALFSATMPTAIVNLAQKYMHDAERITVAKQQKSTSQIRQIYYEVGKRDKFEMLARILDYELPTSAIIFCRTKLEVDALGQRLMARAHAAEMLHGDLSQAQRDRVMARFRSGQVELLIATDVAARGLDVESVSHVINYDLPQDTESYIHRIGRTGRAGRSGSAISLVTRREGYLLQMIQRTTNNGLQKMRLPTADDVLLRRNEQLKKSIAETIEEGDLDTYLNMAEELSEEYTLLDIAAVALKLMMGETPELSDVNLAEPEDMPTSRKREGRDRGDRNERGGERKGKPSRGGEANMTRLKMSIGRKDGLRPSDVVGAIANEADIPGRSIGAIEIYENFTLVDVPTGDAQKVMQSLKDTRIRNQKVVITPDTPPKKTRKPSRDK